MKNVKKLILINFLITFSLFIPLESLYFNSLGFTSTQITTIVLSITVLIGVLSIPTGFLSDLFSRKLIASLAIVSFLLSYLFLFLTTNYYLILTAYFFEGLAWSLAAGNNESLLRESSQSIEAFDIHLSKYHEVSFLALLLCNTVIIPFSWITSDTKMAILMTIFIRIIAFFLVLSIKDVAKKNEKTNTVKNIFSKTLVVVKENKTIFLMEGLTKFTFFFPVVYQIRLLGFGMQTEMILSVALFGFFLMYLGQKIYPKLKFSHLNLFLITGFGQAAMVLLLLSNVLVLFLSGTALIFLLNPIKIQVISIYKHKIATEEIRTSVLSFYGAMTAMLSGLFYFLIGLLIDRSYSIAIIIWGITLSLVTIIGYLFLKQKSEVS